MNSGAGRPGTPIMGQRSIFGGGRGPVFAQVPAYTPVTRAPDPREQHAPEPPKPDYGVYARQGGEPHPSGVAGYSSPNGAPQAYPRPNTERGAPNDYSTPTYPSPTPPAQTYAAQPQPRPQSQPSPAYPPQTYAPQPQPNGGYAAPSYQPQAQPSPVRPSQANPAQAYQPQANPAPNYREQNFPDRIFAEPAAHGAATADADFTEANFPDASFPDASFPDASFGEEQHAETGFAANAAHSEHFGAREHALDLDAPADGYGGHDFAPHAVHEYVSHAADGDGGYGRGLPPHQALQAFDAPYDQPPQIPLGPVAHSHGGAQDFYDGDQGDADFLDEGQLAPGQDAAKLLPPRKSGLRSRSMFMVGSALLGAIALGGALAFAYKQSGGAMNGGQPPLVQADNRPVKEPPQQAGGKDAPHKNKLIYERLENGDQPEAEHVVPRQEDVAMPAMPGASPAAGADAGAAPAAPPAVATVDDPNAADGGPRRVKTLVVRPDGSVQAPPAAPQEAAAQAPAAPQQAAMAPQQMAMAEPALPPQAAPAPVAQPAAAPVAADPQPVAAIPAAKPKPKAAAAAVVAAADPAPKAAGASQYVVQVGSEQNQTAALATFADLQQKYPALLQSYRPMVQKADLGAKGVWYRLRIGPITDKTAAAKLCSQLKSQGHSECLVTAAQ
jgi:hypothetical protein